MSSAKACQFVESAWSLTGVFFVDVLLPAIIIYTGALLFMVGEGCLLWYELVIGVGVYLLHSLLSMKQYIVSLRTLCLV